MHRPTTSKSNTTRSISSPVQVSQELWQRVQEDMEVKESNKWMQHRMDDSYDHHHYSLDDSKFNSPPHVVKRLVSVPNLVASREVSDQSLESIKEMDPEMGVHSPPLSLKRFTQVNQLDGSQQDRLLQAIAQIASPMKQTAPQTPPTFRRHSLDLVAAVEDVDVVAPPKHNKRQRAVRSKSTRKLLGIAVGLVLLVGINCLGMMIIRMSSKFQIKCLWFRCNQQPHEQHHQHDVHDLQPSATTETGEDQTAKMKKGRQNAKAKVNQRYQINMASRRQDMHGRFVENHRAAVHLDRKQNLDKKPKLVEQSCVVSSTGECLSIIHTPSDERNDVSVGKLAHTKLIDLPYTEIFQRGSFKHHGANPNQRQHEEDELKKDANVDSSAGNESTPTEKLEVARNWNKIHSATATMHSGTAKVFHRRHAAGVPAPTRRTASKVEHDNEECTAKNVPMFAHWGDLDLVRKCVSQHPEWVDHADGNSWTALHEATVAGLLDMVQYLVHAGASVKVANNRGRTPYREALHGLGPHHEVTKFLQGYEPEVPATEKDASAEQTECTENRIQTSAYMGDLFELQRCLSLHPQWMSKEYDRKWTPLHYATRGGNTNVVQYLVKAGANLQARTEQGHTALELALEHLGREHPLSNVLRHATEPVPSVDPNVVEPQKQVENIVEGTEKLTKEGNQAASASDEQPKIVDTAGVDVVSPKDDGCLPQQIHWLADVGKLEELQRCCALHPTLVSHADERGWTPMHEAARAGHAHVIEYLLQAGVDAEARTHAGHSAWDLAVRKGEDHPAAQILLRHKPAQQQQLSAEKPSPVNSSTETQQSGTETQPSATTQTHDASNTPAVTTVQEGGVQTVSDEPAKQADDCTPAQLKRSIHSGQLVEVQRCISLHPEYATGVDDLGWTPLHEASRSAQPDIAKYLLEAGANAGALNKLGYTALDLAVERHGSDHAVTRVLKEHSEQTLQKPGTETQASTDTQALDTSNTPAVTTVQESGVQFVSDEPAKQAYDCTPQQLKHSIHTGQIVDVKQCLSLHPEYATGVDDLGWTPLHEASRFAQLDITKYLLEVGAYAGALNKLGHTALDLAVERHGHDHAVTRVLKEHSEQSPRSEISPSTMFNVESKQSKAEPVIHIESPQKSPSPNDTPAVASEPSRAQGVNSEDAKSVRGNAVDTTKDCSAFDFLSSSSLGELENVKRCLSLYPSFITATDESGWTALHEAVRSGHIHVVEYLLQAGASVKSLTTNGKHSSLDLARHVLGEDHAVTRLLKTAADS